ncbi:hypothetical protein CUJ84_pRLN3000335 (plasmid) [Rhizobium leguminosarum]|uniref:Transposase n=1 Tax=Rhizobium leguminosarum TaxID=384 RepID=A0A2K9ZGV2_RHILE|nr:hypothetical protein CUJ84_pRLN3000335 [Rhizobium leguminosarum]
MGQVLHGSATTTEAVRRAIQHSQESLRTLSRRYGIIRRPSPSGGSDPRLRTFRPARKSRDRRCFPSRRRPLSLPFAGIRCCRSMTASMHCSRQSRISRGLRCIVACSATASAAYRMSKAIGRRRLRRIENDPLNRFPDERSRAYPISYFHIDIAEVRTEQGKLHMFVAIDGIQFTTPGAGGNWFTATTLT